MTVDPDEDEDEDDDERIRASIAGALRDAFASVPQPTPPVTDASGLDYVERALGGKPASAITPDDARYVRMDLWLLTPEAYRYYLPPLLDIYLTGSTFVDGLGGFAFKTLVPPEDPGAAEIFHSRMDPLDDRQRAALSRYVEWYLDEEPSARGRDGAAAYWLGKR